MNKHIIHQFEKTVINYPNKNAVLHNNEKLTFLELKKKALSMAISILIKSNGVKNRPICVFLPKSKELVISNVAVMYSCNILNNLDVKTPTKRIKSILELLEPELIITNTQNIAAISIANSNNVKVINIDELELEHSSAEEEKVYSRIDAQVDSCPFCIINTSGSTGIPKGVVLTYRGFRNYIDWACDTFGFNGNEVLGVMSSVVFDHYMYETCLMMCIGSTLVLLDMIMAAFPVKLLKEIQEKEVNYIFWVPTVMVNIANQGLLEKFELPKLNMIWFAGEVFPSRQLSIWRKRFPRATIVNLYGPCEITVDCTYHIVEKDFEENDVLPIGIPCNNYDVFLLNESNEICHKDEIGEICVRGSSLALGYYNNPEKTSAAFVQHPINKNYPETIYRTGDMAYKDENGLFIFKGRGDTLVKHMGNRVELGEIEHIVVNSLYLAKNACAVYDYLNKEIVLFYEKIENFNEKDIKVSLSKEVPRYMVPARYVLMDELPRNTNGKIDRLKLKESIEKNV